MFYRTRSDRRRAPRLSSFSIFFAVLPILILSACDGSTTEPTSEVPQDSTEFLLRPPPPVSDLRVVESTETSVTLEWTEINAGWGRSARYVVVAGTPTVDISSPNVGQQELRGRRVGDKMRYVWSGLSPATEYEFRVGAYRWIRLSSSTSWSSGASIRTDGQGGATLSELRATPSAVEFDALGQERSIDVVGIDGSGNQIALPDLTWSTSALDVAVVAGGKIESVGPGQGSVTISTAGGVNTTVPFSVVQRPVRAEIVSANGALQVGQSRALSANAFDAGDYLVAGASASWASSAPAIASVDAGGKVTALKPGTATIVATIGGISAQASVEVLAPTSPTVVEVRASSSSESLSALGASVQLTARAFDSNGTPLDGEQLVWQSLSSTIATVSAGLVTAISQGTAQVVVSAACCDVADTVEVAVSQAPARLELDATSLSLDVGASARINVIVRDANGFPLGASAAPGANAMVSGFGDVSGGSMSSAAPAWSSSNPSVVTVDDNGVVSAVSDGSATVSASVDGLTASADVNVSGSSVTPPSMPQNVTIDVGNESGGSFDAVVSWSAVQGASSYRIAAGREGGGWSFSDGVTSTSTTLEVPWASGGQYWVCVNALSANGDASPNRCNGFAAPASGPAAIAQVIASPSSISLSVGSSQGLSATVRDANGNTVSGASVQWSSANTSIATVTSGGSVTGRAAGSTLVIATVAGVSDSVAVSVSGGATPPPPPPPSGGSLLLDESWNYSSTAALVSDPRHDDSFTRGDGQIRLATGLSGTPWGGTTAVRRYWPSGMDGAPQVGLGVEIPNADQVRPTELWIEVYANFGGHNQGGRTGDKVLFIQDEDYNRWDLMQNTGTRIISTGGNAGVWNDGVNPNWSRGTYPSGGNYDFASQMVGVDRWYRLRFHVRMGRGDGNGSFTAWIDNTRVFQASGANTNEAGDYFRYIQIGANSAAGSGAYQDFGRLRIYTSNPGW
jgi:uncharacterized protein YjdB